MDVARKPYAVAGQNPPQRGQTNTRPTPWPDKDPMDVASDYICAATSPTPSPDRTRSLKAHGVDDPIPVAIYHACGLRSFTKFAA
eukprot:6921200-Heterocapsa_arctica.AAC.1